MDQLSDQIFWHARLLATKNHPADALRTTNQQQEEVNERLPIEICLQLLKPGLLYLAQLHVHVLLMLQQLKLWIAKDDLDADYKGRERQPSLRFC